MTTDRLTALLHFYRAALVRRGVVLCEDADGCAGAGTHYGHLAWMCGRAAAMPAAGEADKAMRWLGYVQGVLVARGAFTLDQVRAHSRPGEPLPALPPESA